jgi:hypothetical protein
MWYNYSNRAPMKPQISNRLVIAAMFVATVPLSLAAGHQDNNQASTQTVLQGVPDRFIGVWKLRVDRPPHAGTFSEVMTIEGRGKNYKFTYDQSFGNRTEYHLWYVTEMKGEIVTDTHVNGQPKPGKSRITRIDSGSFKVEGEIQKDVYKVSSDGQTMKLRRTFPTGMVIGTTRLQDESMLYDRQK